LHRSSSTRMWARHRPRAREDMPQAPHLMIDPEQDCQATTR
jgi:hypothetical protein